MQLFTRTAREQTGLLRTNPVHDVLVAFMVAAMGIAPTPHCASPSASVWHFLFRRADQVRPLRLPAVHHAADLAHSPLLWGLPLDGFERLAIQPAPSACRFDRDGPTHAATRVEYRAASRDRSARPPARTRVAGQSQRNDPARAGSEPKLDIRARSPGSLSRRSRWLWQFHIASIRVLTGAGRSTSCPPTGPMAPASGETTAIAHDLGD